MLSETTELRDKLEVNTMYFREQMTAAGFDIQPGVHPIVPIMLYDAVLSQKMAEALIRKRDLCNRVLFPCGTKRQGKNQGADFCWS